MYRGNKQIDSGDSFSKLTLSPFEYIDRDTKPLRLPILCVPNSANQTGWHRTSGHAINHTIIDWKITKFRTQLFFKTKLPEIFQVIDDDRTIPSTPRRGGIGPSSFSPSLS